MVYGLGTLLLTGFPYKKSDCTFLRLPTRLRIKSRTVIVSYTHICVWKLQMSGDNLLTSRTDFITITKLLSWKQERDCLHKSVWMLILGEFVIWQNPKLFTDHSLSSLTGYFKGSPWSYWHLVVLWSCFFMRTQVFY